MNQQDQQDQQAQQAAVTPIQRITVLSNNAIDAVRAFYSEALARAYEQAQRDAQLNRQLVEQIRAQQQRNNELSKLLRNEQAAIQSLKEQLKRPDEPAEPTDAASWPAGVEE